MEKTNNLLIITSFMFLSGVSSVAISKGIDYNYVGATYNSVTDSSLGTNVNANGFTVGGSVGLTDNIAVSANTSYVSYDSYQGISIDSNAYSAGIRGHIPLSPQADVYAGIGIIHESDKATYLGNSVTTSDNGNVIAAGLHFLPAESVVLGASYARTDIYSTTSNTATFSARYYVNNNVSLGASYGTGDNVDTIAVGARYDFK